MIILRTLTKHQRSKKVSKTQFNVLTETYEEIELGDGSSSFTSNAVVSGDNVSSLTNDKNYANKTTVTNLIAENINADFIKAVNAEITEAQIETLTSESITTTLIEAESFAIDELVAQLLVTDDAAIRNQLTVGENLIVNGEVNINNGSISITNDGILNFTKAWINTLEGTIDYSANWLKANYDDELPLDPTTRIEEIFKVYNKNNVWTQEYYKWDNNKNKYVLYTNNDSTKFLVDSEGNLTANSADITGKITATSGEIGGAIIENGILKIDEANIDGTISADTISGGTIRASEILLRNAEYIQEAYINNDAEKFSSDWLKNINEEIITPEDDSLYEILDSNGKRTFECYKWSNANNCYEEYENYTCVSIDDKGSLEANSINLAGGTIEDLSITGKIYFGDNYIQAYEISNDESIKYTSKWLTNISGKTTPLTPNERKIYIVDTIYAKEFYKWDNTENKYIKTDGAVIDEDGIYMPGITATSDGTNIAGFTISDNTMISENTILLEDGITKKTKLVGISSAESEDYAFWAGPPDATGENPFYVTHEGEIHAMAGKIGAFNMFVNSQTKPILTSNIDKKELYDNNDGMILSNDGIGFYNSQYETKVVISTVSRGIYSTNIAIDPFNIGTATYDDKTKKMDKHGASTLLMLSNVVYSDPNADSVGEKEYSSYSEKINIYGSFYQDTIYEKKKQRFVQLIRHIPITRLSKTTLTFNTAEHGGFKNLSNDISDNIRPIAAFSSQYIDFDSPTPLEGKLFIKVDSENKTIEVYNNASYNIHVQLLIIFEKT